MKKASQPLAQSRKKQQEAGAITVRFAGDSGDGIQLAGDQFTDTAAVMGNDFSTFPDFPAEIRAPAGTLPGVSSFQIQFSDSIIFTPGDQADALITMNPAALKVDLKRVRPGGLVIVNENAFNEMSLKKAAWQTNPLTDKTLEGFELVKVPLGELTIQTLKPLGLVPGEVDRCKNFTALGIIFWIYNRSMDHTIRWIQNRFAKRPEIVQANIAALQAGFSYAEATELLPVQFHVKKAALEPGTYRKITGNEAVALGLITAARLANKTLFYGSYPITPASTILHELALHKNFGVKVFQAEDEIAAMGAAIGAAYGGEVGATGTSGPGMCLKSEALNLAVMVELPVVVVNVQRGGPSTGMPTKTEQTDLLQALFGRHGESPIAVVAARSPADCFWMALEATRIAIHHMTPVIYLTESYLANAAEPWKLPDIEQLPEILVKHPAASEAAYFKPYARDPKTFARPWGIPGIAGLEHRVGGLAKADQTGHVSYAPENNQKLTALRAEKILRIAEEIPEQELLGPPKGKLLILGWGGTFGTIRQAAAMLKESGITISHAHLNYLNPFPKNLGEILKRFEQVLVPELNMGQLLFILKSQFPEVCAVGLHKVQGIPLEAREIIEKVRKLL